MLEPTGECRACGAPMLWATMPSGKANPLDLEQVEAAKLDEADQLVPCAGVIAYRHETSGGMPVVKANLGQMLRWAEEGHISFHVSHFATCPSRERFKR